MIALWPLALAALLLYAQPAAANIVDVQNTSPATLTENNLDGATVYLRGGPAIRFSSAHSVLTYYTLSGYPSGTTVSVTGATRYNVSLPNDRKGIALRLRFTGDLTSPMSLRIRVAANAFLKAQLAFA